MRRTLDKLHAAGAAVVIGLSLVAWVIREARR
jgi:hypothetical protein